MIRICFLFLIFLVGCSRDTEYLASDFRIFKDTKSWKLAKYVDENDVDGIEREIAKDSSLLSFQENKYGMSVLHLAVYNNKFKAFNRLLELGFKLDLYDYETGSSPFLVVCGELDEKEYYRYFAVLIKNGADINQTMVTSSKVKQDLGYSALMYASSKGNVKIVESLLGLGVNKDYLNSENRNAFSVAVNTEHLKIASVLLENGTDCHAVIHYKYDEYQNRRPVYICEFLEKDKFVVRNKVFLNFEQLVKTGGGCPLPR